MQVMSSSLFGMPNIIFPLKVQIQSYHIEIAAKRWSMENG